LDGIYQRIPVPKIESKHLEGSSPPSVFVGRFGYPAVNVGPVMPPVRMEDASELGDPAKWFGQSVEEVISKRFSLVRGQSKIKIRAKSRFTPLSNPQRLITELDSTRAEVLPNRVGRRILEASQELAMSARSVDVDMQLSKLPRVVNPSLSGFTAPYGPNANIKQAKLIDNPSVPRKVDAIVGDTDALAADGMKELYGGGIPLRHIMELLSIGLLGQKRRRRLVPTRWSITAADDTLGKALVPGVLSNQQIGQIELYQDQYVGNHFYLILIPYAWHFDMIETWLQGAFWAREDQTLITDWEGPKGRKRYASNVTGAYYAARLEVLNHLTNRRRQAACLLYREITEDYWAPLGVWVIRETVKSALKKKPLYFDDIDYAVKFVTQRVRGKKWFTGSRLLKQVKTQKRLEDY
jgi:hypothetical protein